MEVSTYAFCVAGESKVKMSEELTVRWYIGKFNRGRVFAIYRAEFNSKILLKEEQWSIPSGKAWEATRRVSEWFFIGNDNVWETTEEIARSYLPKI